MTVGNRRVFLKGSAAVGLLSASEARAVDDTPPPTIMLLHSTNVESDLEEAFLAGLRSKGWEGDPTQPLGGNKPVSIRQVHGLGKYGANNLDALKTAAQALQNQTPSPKLFVAAGGNVTAMAINAVDFATDTVTKIVGVYGGQLDAFEANERTIGINLGLPLAPDQTTVALQKIVTALNNAQQYNLPFEQMCLLYNGNSQIQQAAQWATYTSNKGVSYDATLTHASGENGKIDFAKSIDNALDQTDDTKMRALVITSDPFFTLHRARIIRRLKHKKKVVACFPFQEYVSDALEADFSKADCMGWGPILSDAYKALGQSAGDTLSGNFTHGKTGVKFFYFGK